MTEKYKLYKAVDEFADAMKARLIQKQKQGFSGWNNKDIHSESIPTKLFHKASEMYAVLQYGNKKIRKKILVDIANFSMMLWRKI